MFTLSLCLRERKREEEHRKSDTGGNEEAWSWRGGACVLCVEVCVPVANQTSVCKTSTLVQMDFSKMLVFFSLKTLQMVV